MALSFCTCCFFFFDRGERERLRSRTTLAVDFSPSVAFRDGGRGVVGAIVQWPASERFPPCGVCFNPLPLDELLW